MSNKNKITLILVLFALFMAFSLPVAALREDFTISSQNTVNSGCSCSLATEKIIITNTGDITSVFSIAKSGSASLWTTLSESQFELNAGASKEIYVNYAIPCSANGNYDAVFTVQTNFGLAKQVIKQINVNSCPSLQLSFVSGENDKCPCTPMEYKFLLGNTRDFAESYLIETDDINVVPADSRIILGPKEQVVFSVFVNEECGFYGDGKYTMSVLAEGSKTKAETTVNYHVKPCYDYSITTPENVKTCNGVYNLLNANLKNDADVANQYYLTLEGKDKKIATLSEPDFFLWEKQNKSFTIGIDALDAGNYTFNLVVNTKRGSLEGKKPINVFAENCFSQEMALWGTEEENAIVCENKTYTITLKNDGTRDNIYNLSANAENIYVSQSMVSLAAGKEKNVSVKISLPCNETGIKSFDIYSASANALNATSVETLGIDLTVYSEEDAYFVTFGKTEFKSYYGEEKFNIPVKNDGIREAIYNVKLNGSDLSFVELETKNITLMPGEEKNITIITSAEKYDAESEEGNLEGNYGFTVFMQPKGKELAYANDVKITLVAATLGERLWNFMNNNLLWFIIGASVLALIILLFFIIRAIKNKPRKIKEIFITPVKVKKQRTWNLKWLIPIVILLLLVSGGWLLYNLDKLVPSITESEGPTVTAGQDNLVRIHETGDVKIPVIIKNNAKRNVTYDIIVENTDWIDLDTNKLKLGPEQSKTIYLTVHIGKGVTSGNYEITMKLALEDKSTIYSESIKVQITKEKTFVENYLNYFVLGAIIAAAIIILFLVYKGLAKYSDYMKRTKDVRIASRTIDRLVSRETRMWIKTMIFILLFALFIVGILFVAVWITNAPAAETVFSANATGVNGTGNIINLRESGDVRIPIVLKNNAKRDVSYTIDTEDVSWVTSDKDKVLLGPNEGETIYLTVKSDDTVKDGIYSINIDVKVEDKELLYSEKITLDVKRSQNSLISYVKYIIAGIAFTLFLIWIINKNKKEIALVDTAPKEFGKGIKVRRY